MVAIDPRRDSKINTVESSNPLTSVVSDSDKLVQKHDFEDYKNSVIEQFDLLSTSHDHDIESCREETKDVKQTIVEQQIMIQKLQSDLESIQSTQEIQQKLIMALFGIQILILILTLI